MSVDIDKINRTKDKILSTISLKGPSLPIQIAKSVGIENLFCSAFLSELKGENKIKTSYMRVGSSPIYYLTGQEALLENFIEFLNQREKEAFHLIKKEKILKDSEQNPVIRVALASIKDFVSLIKIKSEEGENILWKYHLTSDEEFNSIIDGKKKEKEAFHLIKKQEEIEKEPKLIEKKEEVKKVEFILLPENSLNKLEENKTAYKFPEMIKDFLNKKNMKVLSSDLEKKKEMFGKISIETLLGNQSIYLIAKDKKSINELDINAAIMKSQEQKMPSLLLSTGSLTKKAQNYLKEWENIVKFLKLE